MLLTKTNLLCLCGIFLTGFVHAAPIDDFRIRLKDAPDSEAAYNTIMEYASKLNNEEDLRELQDAWLKFDKEGCQKHFRTLFKQNPQSAKFWYLSLRTQDDEDLVLEESANLCRAFPDYYWGYRLFISSLMAWMLEAGYEVNNPLEDADYELKILDEGYKRFPKDDYFNILQFHRYRITGDYPRAETFLWKVRDNNLLKAHWLYIRYYLVISQNVPTYESFMPKLLKILKEDSAYTERDSLSDYAQGYVSILEETRNWPKLEVFFTKYPILLENWAYFDSYAIMLADTNRWEELMQQLSLSVENGVVNQEQRTGYGKKWQLDQRAQWPAIQQKAAEKAREN